MEQRNSLPERRSGIEAMLGPILENNKDIILANGFLFVDPIAHICRRISTTRSPLPDHVFLEWSVDVLFLMELSQTAWGPIAAKNRKRFIEAVSLPDYLVSDAACREVETKHLPLLRKLDSLEACYDYLINRGRPVSLWPERHFPLELAMGNFDAAHMLMRWHRERWLRHLSKEDSSARENHKMVWRLSQLLEAGDTEGIRQVLREAEAITAKKLGISDLWRPAEFPSAHVS
jgi:hypothetical protein